MNNNEQPSETIQLNINKLPFTFKVDEESLREPNMTIVNDLVKYKGMFKGFVEENKELFDNAIASRDTASTIDYKTNRRTGAALYIPYILSDEATDVQEIDNRELMQRLLRVAIPLNPLVITNNQRARVSAAHYKPFLKDINVGELVPQYQHFVITDILDKYVLEELVSRIAKGTIQSEDIINFCINELDNLELLDKLGRKITGQCLSDDVLEGALENYMNFLYKSAISQTSLGQIKKQALVITYPFPLGAILAPDEKSDVYLSQPLILKIINTYLDFVGDLKVVATLLKESKNDYYIDLYEINRRIIDLSIILFSFEIFESKISINNPQRLNEFLLETRRNSSFGNLYELPKLKDMDAFKLLEEAHMLLQGYMQNDTEIFYSMQINRSEPIESGIITYESIIQAIKDSGGNPGKMRVGAMNRISGNEG